MPRLDMPTTDEIQIFSGEANPVLARIYVRVPRPPNSKGWRLTGTVTGPSNALAATLPATVRLRDRGPGDSLLAEAVLPDPCFWSPQSPALYEVQTAVVDAQGAVRDKFSQVLGVRSLGIRNQSFFLEGRRWVLRAAGRRHAPGAPLSAWPKASAAMFAESPDDDLCRDASELGVLIAASVSGNRRDVEGELRRLSRWAAVAMVVIEDHESLDETITRTAPNIILAHWGESAGDVAPPWARATFVLVGDVSAFDAQWATLERPVVAVRKRAAPSLEDARAGCDHLQRDLSPRGDFAGYILT